MHPPRPNRTTERQGLFDRLIDWLLVYCPFSTVTVLTLTVIAPTLGPVPNPAYVAVAVIVADLLWLVIRRLANRQPRDWRTTKAAPTSATAAKLNH